MGGRCSNLSPTALKELDAFIGNSDGKLQTGDHNFSQTSKNIVAEIKGYSLKISCQARKCNGEYVHT